MKTKSIFGIALITASFFAHISSALAAGQKRFDGYPDAETGYINKLLTYEYITASDITLTPGASNLYPIHINFHKKIDPTNVIIELNGRDISDKFTFEQGEANFVELTLVVGENRLELRALELITDGSGLAPMWDNDSFTITLPPLQQGFIFRESKVK